MVTAQKNRHHSSTVPDRPDDFPGSEGGSTPQGLLDLWQVTLRTEQDFAAVIHYSFGLVVLTIGLKFSYLPELLYNY